MSNTSIRTMKLKINVFENDKEQKQKTWNRIRQINNDVWKASNKIVQGQYENDILMDKMYTRFGAHKDIKTIRDEYEKLIKKTDDNVQIDLLEKECESKIKKIVLEMGQKFKSVFGTLRQATTQNDVNVDYDIPGNILNPLNNEVYHNYISDKKKMYLGERSIRSYKKGVSFPLVKDIVSIEKKIHTYMDDNKQKKIKDIFVVTLKISRKETMKFEVYLGKDKADYKSTLEKIVNNDYKFGVPRIQLKEKQLFLILPVYYPKKHTALDPDVSVGVDLGIHITAYLSVTNSSDRFALGSGMNIVRFKTQFQKRKNKLKKDCLFARGGKGKKRKNKAKVTLSQLEHNTNNNYNDVISKKIIEFALKNNAGTIKLEFLKGISENKKNNMILKNWTFFQLQVKIKYKAKEHNIKVVMIDPYLTSYTCSNCGNKIGNERVDDERPLEYFKCGSCEKEIHADYNASLNIARSNNIVTKSEDCMYNILQNEKKHCKNCTIVTDKNFKEFSECNAYKEKVKQCKFISNDVYLKNLKDKKTIKTRITETLNIIKENSMSQC